jgi:hypothetical protein
VLIGIPVYFVFKYQAERERNRAGNSTGH